jgi:rRNA maturation RNase YbeY
VSIFFSLQDYSTIPLEDQEIIRDWITKVVENKGFRVGFIQYIFCSEKYIHEVNEEFLSHDYPTDIITFDYSQRKKISGDILIAIPVVQENASNYHVFFFQELLRVLIHGVLHLLGYPDYTEQEKERMRKEEDLAIQLFFEISSTDHS